MIAAAIVGLGRWGRGFCESVQGKSARLRFVHAADSAPEAARDLAARHGFRLSPDFSEALADPEVQALVLATPHSLHRDQVLACARAGKHVFCEKPLALKRADAERMIGACAKAGVVLGVGHNRRLWPSMQALKRTAESGELGQILHIEGHFSNEHSNNVKSGWRLLPEESPGAGMTGAGLHVLDAFINLAGPVRRVHAQIVSQKPAPAPLDTLSALYEFANGVSGMLATIRATPQYWRVHVFGAKASAEAVGEKELLLHRSGAAPQRQTFEAMDSQRAELEAFADAIEKRAAFHIPPAQMLATVAAFEATVESAESGKTIVLDIK